MGKNERVGQDDGQLFEKSIVGRGWLKERIPVGERCGSREAGDSMAVAKRAEHVSLERVASMPANSSI
jgi:hypothetical protein